MVLRLAARNVAPVTVASPFAFAYASAYNLSGYAKRPTPSPDGRLMMYASTIDPNAGLTDIQLLDLHNGLTITVDNKPVNFAGSDVFTSDSRYSRFQHRPR
jgi:hypothetical protein